jgi:hypothetical protein
MLIENFIIYKYDNVFYTKEELEQMGFIYMCSREDYMCLKGNTPNYKIIEISGKCEFVHYIEEYLHFEEKDLIGKFLYDFSDHGLILGVEQYFGIRYKNEDNEEIVQLFADEGEWYDAYLKIDSEIKKMFENFSRNTTYIYKEYGAELIKQSKVKETRNKVLSLINKEKL